ncbi:MAG: non-canonical purine NTP pyrophosphatase [archaeon]
MEKKIYLLTKNKGKLLAAKKIFDQFGIELGSIEKEFPEIQASSSSKIAKFSSEAAAKEFNVPVLREDHGLYIESLQYFPGPFTSFFDENIDVKILLKMLENFENWNAEMELAASLTIPGRGTFESVYRVPLEISKKIRGKSRNWDKVLKLRGAKKTFSESTEEENVGVWTKNYQNLAKKFLEIYNSVNTG